MLSVEIIIRFIMCRMSFPNTQSFICWKITSSVHFSAQDLSHIVSFFELWTKKPLCHHRVPRHLSLSVRHRSHTVYVKLNSTAHHSGKEAASSEVIVLDGWGGKAGGVFVWTGDALLHNEWSALCGPDSFNMGLHAFHLQTGRHILSKQKKSQQWQL